MMTVQIEKDENGDFILPLSDELCDHLGVKIGDNVKWTDNGNGTWSITKAEQETELVLVETFQTFKHTYVVRVPKGKAEWALDTVVCEEADEMSQEHLGEQIFSHRTITKEEYLKEFDARNAYLSEWDEEQKMNFITDATK
jgi:hypothetical protein